MVEFEGTAILQFFTELLVVTARVCISVYVCVSSLTVSIAAEEASRPKFEGELCFT